MSEVKPDTADIDWIAISDTDLNGPDQDLRFTIPTTEYVRGDGYDQEHTAPLPVDEPVEEPPMPETDVPEPEPIRIGEPEIDEDTTLDNLLNGRATPEPAAKSKKTKPKLLSMPKIPTPRIPEKIKTAAAKANRKPGLVSATKELRDKKEQLSYMGRGFGASVKKLGNIDQQKDADGNPLPYSYSYQDVLQIVKEEKANERQFTGKELQERLANGGVIGRDSGDASLRLQEDLAKVRKKLQSYNDRQFDNLTNEVEKYRALKNEVKANEEQYKAEYGFTGRVALGGMNVAWGVAATASYASQKAFLNPSTQANIERIKKYAPYAKAAGAVLTAAGLVGGALAAKHGFNPFEGLNAPIPKADDNMNMLGDASSNEVGGGLGDHPDAGEELRGLGEPEDAPDAGDEPAAEGEENENDGQNSTAEELEPGETTATESLTTYTGELNEDTGLMDGTASNSAALKVMDLGVDFDKYQDDPQFQTDLYDLTKESLISQGIDVDAGEDRSLPDDFQLELRNDLLQDFLGKYGTETPEALDESASQTPLASFKTADHDAPLDLDADSPVSLGQSEQFSSGDTAFDAAIKDVAEQIPGLNPELAVAFKNALMSNPNMISELYSGTLVTAQEALAYANLHNSLTVPPLDAGYEQFVENMQRLIENSLSTSDEDEEQVLAA